MTVFLSYGTMGRHKYSKLTNNVFSTTYDIIQLLRKLHDPSNIRCVCTVVTGSAARSIHCTHALPSLIWPSIQGITICTFLVFLLLYFFIDMVRQESLYADLHTCKDVFCCIAFMYLIAFTCPFCLHMCLFFFFYHWQTCLGKFYIAYHKSKIARMPWSSTVGLQSVFSVQKKEFLH